MAKKKPRKPQWKTLPKELEGFAPGWTVFGSGDEFEFLVDAAVKLFQDPQIPAGEVFFVGGSPHENWVEETRIRTEAICRN